jgi:hypothetical protein
MCPPSITDGGRACDAVKAAFHSRVLAAPRGARLHARPRNGRPACRTARSPRSHFARDPITVWLQLPLQKRLRLGATFLKLSSQHDVSYVPQDQTPYPPAYGSDADLSRLRVQTMDPIERRATQRNSSMERPALLYCVRTHLGEALGRSSRPRLRLRLDRPLRY